MAPLRWNRAFPVLLTIGLLLWSGSVLHADEPTYGETFLRAERSERALGNLEAAVGLYSEAAELARNDAGRRARAELRAATCLRRLGRVDEARKLLMPWTTTTVTLPEGIKARAVEQLALLSAADVDATEVPTLPGPASEDAALLLRTLREQNARLQDRLERALKSAGSVDQKEMDRLLGELRDREDQIARLREEQEASSPSTATEALEYSRELKRRRARLFVKAAQIQHREGHFADARAFLLDALAADPDNADARALLGRISAPLGDRERLFQEILEAVALAHQVRRGRLAAEVHSLVDEGRRRVLAEDAQGAVDPLERALALVGVATDAFDDPAELRSDIVGLLRRAVSAGAGRRPVPSPALEDVQTAWLQGLKKLLEHAGAEVSSGLDLRFHDLDRALAVAAAGLPPVGPRPVGWTLSADRVPSAGLLTTYLAAELGDVLRRPGHSLQAVGHTAVARAAASTQEALHNRLAALTISPGGALDLTVSARRSIPGAWDAALARLGIAVTVLPGGARRAVLTPEATRTLAGSLLDDSPARFAHASLVGAPLRAYRLAAGTSAASLTVRVLPVSGERPGVGLRADVTWTPAGRRDGALLQQQAVAGAVLDEGAAMVIFGLADPSDPERDLAVLVQRPLPDGASSERANGPDVKPAVPPAAAGEYLLPRSVAGLLEVGPSALTLPEHPMPSRLDGLRERLAAAASIAGVLDVREDRVVVAGPPEAHQMVRDLLAQLASARIETFEVQFYALDESAERRLIEAVKTFAPGGGAFVWTSLRNRAEVRSTEALLRAVARSGPVLSTRLSPPPTGRESVPYIVRTGYRRALDVDDKGSTPALGRSETSWVDQGLVLGVRPFGRTADDRLDLDLSVRGTFVRLRRERNLETALGPVTVQDPLTADIWGDLKVQLRPEGAVILAGMVNPIPGRLRRLAIVLRLRP